MKTITTNKTTCFHCGDSCESKAIHIDEKYFCCDGCKLVYEILDKNNLCEYYDISENPGRAQKIHVNDGKFCFLDDIQVQNKLIHFREGKQSHVKFYLPQMHCSSCIWLLENLPKLNQHTLFSTVNFIKKEVSIGFNNENFSLRKIAELLTSIGYEPHINLNDVEGKKINKHDRSKIFKLGIAGFCFGNIMMLSFPDYFSLDSISEKQLKTVFSYLNLLLALPVFFYSASEFYTSAWKSLKQKILNIDAPIVLAILITFTRSVYEILTHTGSGYLDSMSGIVFFMLIGRVIQDRSYKAFSFERDYRSYFPVAVSVKTETGEKKIPVSNLKIGDRMVVRNGELIPADAILFYGKANVDYSFVTGESMPIAKTIGEIVYAGGKQIGEAIEMEVVREVSQSYLTQLWNNDAFKKTEKQVSFIHKLGRQFTWVLFAIAAVTATYWYFNDTSKILNAVTSILIVACPCALLLSATFTNGSMLRIFGKNKLYLKNAEVIESLASADHIAFDKTGTITQNSAKEAIWQGETLNLCQQQIIYSLVKQSNHPLSISIKNTLPTIATLKLQAYEEYVGKGIKANINNHVVSIGSLQFVSGISERSGSGGKVYVKFDNELLGHFIVHAKYREHLSEVITELKKSHQLSLLSGDNDGERKYLEKYFGKNAELRFTQTPDNKLNYVKKLRAEKKIMMIGDGLNDAGALRASDIGIALTDNLNNFTPASDAILDASQFSKLNNFISFAQSGKKIIIASFIISILYNIIGLFFAIQGTLSPVIAAILMPVSSVSIVLFTTLSTSISGKLHKLKT